MIYLNQSRRERLFRIVWLYNKEQFHFRWLFFNHLKCKPSSIWLPSWPKIRSIQNRDSIWKPALVFHLANMLIFYVFLCTGCKFSEIIWPQTTLNGLWMNLHIHPCILSWDSLSPYRLFNGHSGFIMGSVIT